MAPTALACPSVRDYTLIAMSTNATTATTAMPTAIALTIAA